MLKSAKLKFYVTSAFLFFIGMLFSFFSFGQLRVDNTRSAVDLVQNVLSDKGVTISNVSSSTNINAIGFFDGSRSNIGLDSGIILSTGNINTAVGPNTTGNTGSSNNQPGDPLITLLNPNEPNFDAAWIEFEVTPESDSLKFRFVFASEEYPENVNKNFNDVFGLFITGQGITGQQNLAVLPNTNTPISINTVNAQLNNQYYIDNTNGTTVEFDGFTKVFEAKVKVIPCTPYILKMVIADVKDLIYDSGIFIEANSLKSISENGVSASVFMDVESECDSNKFFISRNSNDLSKPITVDFELGGTATLNVDYTLSAMNFVTIPAGQLAVAITVFPVKDQLAEPRETVILKITNPIICDTISTVLSISDYKFIDTLEFKYACDDSTIRIYIVDYELLDSVVWKDKDSAVVSFLPALEIKSYDTNYYYVFAKELCTGRSIFDSVRIQRFPISTIPDTTICFGDTLRLFASSALAGAKYEWSTTTFGVFSPSPLSSSPYVIPQRSGKIFVKIINDGICSEVEIDVQVIKFNIESTDVSICGSSSVQLRSGGGKKYKWVPSTFLDNDTIPNPICSADTSITYQLFIENDKCSDVIEVKVEVDTMPIARAPNDMYICSRQFVRLFASGSDEDSYEWFPTNGLDSPRIAYPLANPIVTTTYILKASNGACFSFDTVTIYVVDSISTSLEYNFDSCSKTFTGRNLYDDSKAEIVWDMGNGDTLRSNSIAYQYKEPGLYTIRVVSNPKAPCSTSDEIMLNYPLVDENARRIPNAFSPNGDGNNDYFKIYFGNTQCKINSFQIYNRWGQLVFDSNRDNSFEWDGKYNGEVCAEGIYVYIIDGDGFTDKGWFALIK